MIRPLIHALLHILVPGAVAGAFWRDKWLRVWGLLVLMNLVDLDHLLADPLFDPNRCSIGTHPLHSWWACGVWAGMALWGPTRILGVGLLIHMLLDGIDCTFMP